MIKFVCMLCHEKLSVQEQLAGKRIRCPKCNGTSVVPDESPAIRFACQNCGKGIRVLQIHTGKKAKCPKCQSPIVVPSLRADPETGSETVTVVCSMCNETINVPKGSKDRFIRCPTCSSNVESSLGSEPPESDSLIPQDTGEDQYDEEDDYEDEGPDRRLIFIIAGAAVVVVVALIILITVVLPSDKEPENKSIVSQRREIADADSPARPVEPATRPVGSFTLEPTKENTVKKESEESPAVIDDSRDSDLLLRLKVGQKHSMRIIRQDKVLQTGKGGQLDVSTERTNELQFEVEDVDPNGVVRLKVTYLTIKEKGYGTGAAMQYDSTTPDIPTEYPFAPMYSAMIGRSFTAKVTPGGILAGLDGIDAMYMQIADTIVQGEDEATRKRIAERTTEGVEEAVQRAIKRRNEMHGSRQKRIEHVRDILRQNPFIAEKQLKDMVGNVLVVYPGRTVQPGDSWHTKKSLFSIGEVDLDCTYTVKEKTPALMVVGVSSKIDIDDENISDDTVTLAKTTLKGSYEGTLEINPDSGWLLGSKSTMNCSGEVKMSPSEKLPQGMTLPVSMQSDITVEPIE